MIDNKCDETMLIWFAIEKQNFEQCLVEDTGLLEFMFFSFFSSEKCEFAIEMVNKTSLFFKIYEQFLTGFFRINSLPKKAIKNTQRGTIISAL